MPTMPTLFTRSAARRLGAVAGGVLLLSGAGLTGAAASMRSYHMLGSFHLKRVETTSGATEDGTLLCASTSFGSGPAVLRGMGRLKDPTAACRELAAVNGDFTHLAVHPTWLSPALFAPVAVEAHGTWEGAAVNYSREFTNDGSLAKQTGDVFVF